MPVATRWPLVGRRDDLDGFTSALEDPHCQALCIYGRSGVGKSRLGDECLHVAAALGRRVLRATADRSESTVPLAAIAHLLPTEALAEWQQGDRTGSIARTRMLGAALRAFAPEAGESGPPVLLLDDAHRLDRSSLTAIDQLLAHRAMFGVATVNSGEPVPDVVTSWWRDERAVRIDLGALDPVGLDTLLHVVLEGPIDGAASAEMWRASRGNLLILHELVLAAIDAGSFAAEDGVWRLDGPLATPMRLADYVKVRVDGLSQAGRAVLEVLALCQPVALGELEAEFGIVVLEGLERDGLLEARTDGRRQSVSLAHPLHGEVLRDGMSTQRMQAVMLGHANALESYGARRREDPVRIAMMRLEATGRADSELLLRAALTARADRDFASVVRLAEASLAGRRTAIGGLALGEALHLLGSFDRAENVLAAAADDAPADDIGVAIAAMRRRNRFVGNGRDADEVREAWASTGAEAMVTEAEILTVSGRPLDALDVLQRLDASEPRIRAMASLPQSAALAMVGRTAEALALSRRASEEHVALDDQLGTLSPGAHRVNELFALIEAGRLADAAERGQRWFDLALRARLPLEVMWIAVHLARCAFAQGLPVTAGRWAHRAMNAIDAHRVNGLRPIAAALRAAADGLLGNSARASAGADELERSTAYGAFGAELALAQAWAIVASGDRRTACDVLLAAADDAEQRGCVPAASWVLHDAARLGALGALAEHLAGLAAATDSQLVHLRAEHAGALSARDGARLIDVSERFEALGAVLLAAEATAQAAAAMRDDDRDRASTLDQRASRLAARCEGAKTPALVGAHAAVTLSERERDVAELAAVGHSSRSIADRLSLSVRTVDNHLRRIYAKLGVSGRADLAAALVVPGREDERP